MTGIGMAYLGLGIGLGLLVIGAAYGIGKLAAAAMEGIARQPESAGSPRMFGSGGRVRGVDAAFERARSCAHAALAE
ncbi:MAG: hypothetical protein HY291_06515 [Planctomycetes bacterium]|nr:hypothetical protein [Planctomycetota bacterium]